MGKLNDFNAVEVGAGLFLMYPWLTCMCLLGTDLEPCPSYLCCHRSNIYILVLHVVRHVSLFLVYIAADYRSIQKKSGRLSYNVANIQHYAVFMTKPILIVHSLWVNNWRVSPPCISLSSLT